MAVVAACATGCRTDVEGLGGSDAGRVSVMQPGPIEGPGAPPPGTGIDARAPVQTDARPPEQVDAGAAEQVDAGAAEQVDAGATVATDASVLPGARCTAGQVHCAGKIPQTCGADGTWVNGPPCAFACQGGCVNKYAAVSAGRGSATNDEGVAEFIHNTNTLFSERGGLFGARGFNIAVLDAATGVMIEPVRNFDPWDTRLSGGKLKDMADYLDALEPGRVVMIATCDDAGLTAIGSCEPLDSAPAQRLRDTLARMGSQQITGYCFRGAWSFVTISGSGRALAEKLSSGARVTAEAMVPSLP